MAPLTGLATAIGHTPLIELSRIIPDLPFSVFAKLESLNPGGSLKDRSAFCIIRSAVEKGLLKAGSTVVESSSGNMGIGLAQACIYYGLRLICVVDANTTTTNIALLRAYGAEVQVVKTPDPETKQYLPARIKRVKEILEQTPGSFWTNQYGNLDNALAHHQTMREIRDELGEVEYVFCATSTCGTARGCADYIHENGLSTQLVAVDAIGSVIFGCTARSRLIPGHGAAIRPALYRAGISSNPVHVSDLECVVWCRRLLRQEGILVGGSSGAIMCALDKVKRQIRSQSRCVLILPDRGERYLDSIFSDEWVEQKFGDVSALWMQNAEAESCVTAQV